jgi:hypothetical protein
VAAAVGLSAAASSARADDGSIQGPVAPTPSQASSVADASAAPTGDFLTDCFNMVSRTQEAQPHWMTPLVTVTPRLEQEFRYDQFAERLPTGQKLNNFDAGEGLEIVPPHDTEAIFGLPSLEPSGHEV